MARLDLRAGVQTLSILHWIPFYVLLGATSILLGPYILLFTDYWMLSVLGLVWFCYDWKTHSQGGRRSRWIRSWSLWKCFRDYFPIRLVKTHDLDPGPNYLIANHPHGIFSYGVYCNFATEATGFSRLFPGITPSLATLEGIFWIPLVREYVMAKGVCPVSRSAIMHLLTRNGPGNAVVIVVGGASEALLCRPGAASIILSRRKGFVRLALCSGAHLVPSYSFGENNSHEQELYSEKSQFGYWVQRAFKELLGLSLCVFHGRGFTRRSWGLLPFNRPITTVVGEPLPLPKVENPSQEMVDHYHGLYVAALRRLFDRHKAQYGDSDAQELTIL
ncbi:diacylglycerol O-acyltransferase 2-like protein 6 [Ornithorhynchus anatinus]|uniref:diacylglycerol O-acyltransferase 2-like protein 6 n=1 Tax=Ornithorhynchus anatinus TaxID=9258 RepID=UPI0010A84BB6|nr:diacylglycerol O-acyltransferase 2-like protein 6 [Ornithorhynchus anatinus]